jgi:hypothetical protein
VKRIPHINKLFLCAGFFLLLNLCRSQVINYNFGTVTATYAYNAGATATVFPELPGGIDDGFTNPFTLPFPFQYGCVSKTQIIVSSNGWMTFNTGCIGSDPGNQLAGNATQIANAERPIIAPLWDDLDVSGSGGIVTAQLSGVSPNRILTIEWKKMMWRYSALGPVISFQVKLYETSNRIDFVYLQEANAVNVGSASVGLTGAANGNYYSLNNLTPTAAASFNSGEVTTISVKPASNQSYSWTPVCALPIELVSFTGENSGDKDIFNWITATEKDNDFFTLEGSADGFSFIELQKIKGAGNSHSSKHYQTKTNSGQLTYFRLKQTDFDKHHSYSKTIALENKRKRTVKIYPNPANSLLAMEGVSNYIIYSTSGEEIRRGESGSINMIDISDIPDGLYFIKANETDHFKILIKH